MNEPSHPNAHLIVQVGENAPDFTLLNTDQTPFTLSQATPLAPVVLVFYRGDW